MGFTALNPSYALARKLAVILHRMWVDGTSFALATPKTLVAAVA
jgi:hypothetical protein